MTTPRAQNHSSNGHEKAISEGAGALAAVRDAGSIVQSTFVIATGRTEKYVRANPLKSVGAALGGGILLGVFATKAFTHKPTLTETVHETLGLKRWIAQSIQSWL